MRALITGINGFVGGHLSNLLLSHGFTVYGTDRSEKCNLNKVIHIPADITDKEKVFAIIEKSKPDFIFHLAAVSAVNLCQDNLKLTKNVNIGGTENILRACVDNNLAPKILITSSAHVYGIPKKIPLNENHPTNPVNAYGKSKLEQEKISLKFFKVHKLPVLISRSFNHIGPNQNTGFVCSDFAKQIVEIEKGLKKPEIVVGDILQKRDFTDVRDIVQAYLLLLEKGIPGEIYNIGSGEVYSIQEILFKLIKKSNIRFQIVQDQSLFRNSEMTILKSDNHKFFSISGWKPKIDIDRSLQDILNYWRENFNKIII